MAAKETVLLAGRSELVRDVARLLASQAAERRIVSVSTSASPSSRTLAPGELAVDASSPSASRDFAKILLDEQPDTLVLVGFSESPITPDRPWLADAALAAMTTSALDRCVEQGGKAPALLFLTSTCVYGVAQGSPLVFDERSSLPRENVFASDDARWAQGLRDAERSLVLWAVTARVRVGVLRAASVLGGPLDSPVAALLRARLPLRVAGFDPPCQVLHYDDLVLAIALAIEQRCGEVLNIVGRSVLPLSRLLALAGTFALPLPGPLAERLAPAGFDASHLRWRTLADGSRATALLGFRPQRSAEDCLRAPI